MDNRQRTRWRDNRLPAPASSPFRASYTIYNSESLLDRPDGALGQQRSQHTFCQGCRLERHAHRITESLGPQGPGFWHRRLQRCDLWTTPEADLPGSVRAGSSLEIMVKRPAPQNFLLNAHLIPVVNRA